MSINLTNYALAKKDWSKAYEDLRTLDVGGRNLIRPSKAGSYKAYNSPWSYDESTNTLSSTIKEADKCTLSMQGFPPALEETYTISGYMLIDGKPLSKSVFRDSPTLNNYQTTNGYKIDNSTGRFEFQMYFYKNKIWVIHAFKTMNLPVGTKIELRYLKFEKGNKATDWTPAPEDINAHDFVADMAETRYQSKANADRIKELENAITSLGGNI